MTLVFAALLAVGSAAAWLDVPFIRQPKDGCGSASIWMLMQYWHAPQIDALQDIHREVFSARAGGVYATDIQRYLEAHGFDVFAFSGQWADLQDNLEKGRPLIVSLEGNARGLALHYVVVAGFDNEQQLVLLNDAADRKLRAIRRNEFEEKWSDSQNWTLLATPRDFEIPPVQPKSREMSSAESGVIEDLESATAAFRREDYAAAKRHATAALRKDPEDALANDLIATLFVLDGNLEAALKYWNRLDKPRIRELHIDPPLRLDAVRLDRAFAFSRGSTLNLDDYRRTAARLDGTRALTRYDFELTPTESDAFDLTFSATERPELPMLSWFAGLPFHTVQPRAADIRGSGINIDSMLRWDRLKRRAFLSISGPLQSSPTTRYSIESDARDEEWDIAGSRRQLRKVETKIGLSSLLRSRGTWSSNVIVDSARGSPGVGYAGSLSFDVVRWPEKRLTINAAVRLKAKRVRDAAFARTEVDSRFTWLPRARGSDFATSVSLRAGSATARTPYDELFALGIDRDSELLLHAHPALSHGRKGSAVFARRYGLLNLETEKTVHEFTLMRLSMAPFIDLAKTSGWFADAGAELRVRIASVATFSFSMGKDLRTGRTVYASTYR